MVKAYHRILLKELARMILQNLMSNLFNLSRRPLPLVKKEMQYSLLSFCQSLRQLSVNSHNNNQISLAMKTKILTSKLSKMRIFGK